MTGFLVFLLLGSILSMIGLYYANPVCVFVGGVCCGIMLYFPLKTSSPSAIDVYRNKTTLEITYRDSVAVDSVVVFKAK